MALLAHRPPLDHLERLGLLVLLSLGGCGDTSSRTPAEDVATPAPRGDEETVAPTPDPATARDAARRAATQWQSGAFSDAMESWAEAHAADPTDATVARTFAERLLGNTAYANPQLAFEALERTFGPTPTDRTIQLLRARAAFRSHHYDACRAQLDAWSEDGGRMPVAIVHEAAFLAGSMAERDGDFDAARTAYERGLAAQPRSGLLHCRLGVVQDELGNEESALASIDTAILYEPGLVEAHYHRAGLLRRRGDDDEADRAHAVYTQLLRYTGMRAQTEEAYLERYDALQRLATLLPEYVLGRLKLAEFQLVRELNDEAAVTARAIIVEHPDRVEAYRFYIEALRRSVGDDEARVALEALLADVPDIPLEQQRPLLKIVLEGFAQ